MVIKGFKNRIFTIYHDDEESRFEDDDEEDTIRNGNGLIYYEKLNRLIDLKGRNINDELFRAYFKYQDPSHMLESLNDARNTKRNEIQKI